MGAFRTIVKAWLLILSVFEVIAIGRHLILGQPLNVVMPIHGSGSSAVTALYWVFVAALLGLLRFIQAFNMDSKALWTATAAIHTLEAFFYTYTALFVEKTVPADFAQIGAKNAEATFLTGAIIANAVIFTAAALTTKSKSKQHAE